MKTLIVTPTYNERENIGELIRSLFEIDPDYHLLVVDDNSPDGTSSIVKHLMKSYPNLHILEREGKLGLGTAYITGFQYALDNDFEIVVQMDADMSHDPNDVPRLIEALGESDVVIGSRYCDGVSVVRWPIRRLILSYGANLYSRIVTGLPVKDATGGFKCWRRDALESLDFEDVRSQGYSFQIEMTFRAWLKGFRIQEISIIFIDRTIGESKMNKSIMFEAVFMVWRLKIWKIFGWNR